MTFSKRSALVAFLFAAFLTVQANVAKAVTLLRDPDIEYSLQQLSKPILNAAGLGNSVRVLVVKDSSLNAFVVDNKHIFIHSGLLMRMENSDMLRAVIAHEAAHIANGHLARRYQNFGNARTIAGLGVALAALTAAATGNGEAAAGAALGISSSSQRVFFAHTRAEEASADKSALNYMVRSGADTQGAVDVFDLFRGQELLRTERQDPYVRTHPLTRDRLRNAKAAAQAYAGKAKKDPTAEYWFGRAQGKLSAFLRSPKWTKRTLKNSPSEDVRLMREAILFHRQSNSKKAISTIDRAIAMRPKDPFYYELRGQFLMESRQAKAAVSAYKGCVDRARNNALCLGSYGRALLASGQTKAALGLLERARSIDFRDGRILRDLATAYAKSGNGGMAAVASAERYALQGRMKDAGIQAKRGAGLLAEGSSGWRRAQDIILAAKRAEKKR
ncbi:M48 family metalloprotease [Cognatishimia activa]|uniref:M48 family metalloprotease n=1 Tax=Cognatishimia activa TaxID=1715691 RepID=UPI0006F14965|nr:M48 family metalloprotease [Cognatishimia activa]CUJ28730.1 TPR repeat-containing protein YfgC precursor [Cognatishimia activa]